MGLVIRCWESIWIALSRGHGIVEVVPERGQELVEAGDGVRVLPGVLDQAPDPGFLGCRDLGDVFGPVLHVAAVADLLDDPRVEGVAPLTQVGERELRGVEILRCGRDPGLVGAVAAVEPDPDEADRRRCPVEARSWLISAARRSSWERSACSTCQTTWYVLLSRSATSGATPAGTPTGRIT